MKTRLPRKSAAERGSVILITLVVIVIIAMIAANTLVALNQRYRDLYHANSWQEAIHSAEGGVDLAMAEIRKELSNPDSAWLSENGWADNEAGTTEEGEDTSAPEVGVSAYYTSQTLLRSGEGGNRSWASVAVDKLYPSDAEEGDPPYFRIRAFGYADVPGSAVGPSTSENAKLRKLSLTVDRWKKLLNDTVDPISKPRATRRIEAIAKPMSAFAMALVGDVDMKFTSHNVKIDSFDSSDPEYSTNGMYDSTKTKENGDSGTNDESESSAPIDLSGVTLEGDFMWNGGDGEPIGLTNVTGDKRDDFYQEMIPVVMPSDSRTDVTSPTSITGGEILSSNTDQWQVYDFTGGIDLGSGQNKTLTIQAPRDSDGNLTGETGYVLIKASNTDPTKPSIDISGQGEIVIEPNVYVRVFFEGDITITGNGFTNQTGKAAYLQLYGVSDTDSNGDPIMNRADDGTMREPIGTATLNGNAGFTGTVYAPNYEILLRGGGNSNEDIVGAFVGHTIDFNGQTEFHYDEALRDSGLTAGYRVVTWFEDVR